MCTDRAHLNLALALSDIYAWDIDFTTDLQPGDAYHIVTEGLYLDGVFKKFGKILAAEFTNNGRVFRAYLRETNGKGHYYDEQGKALRRMFLRAPLNFRRISSYYSSCRRHPILKIRRPHLGLDYAAARGTPVSAVGEGIIDYAGWRGQYGKLVVIRHPNRWRTYYGHLSRIEKSIKKGRQVNQGQVIGYVGATGLATGPHLHYEVRYVGKNLDPLKLETTRIKVIPKKDFQDFLRYCERMDQILASGRAISATASMSTERKIKG
jgi:murein DD-endopeptidase MepM/ murein hydrolase activator NlpD